MEIRFLGGDLNYEQGSVDIKGGMCGLGVTSGRVKCRNE